jgi:hypothetical protein
LRPVGRGWCLQAAEHQQTTRERELAMTVAGASSLVVAIGKQAFDTQIDLDSAEGVCVRQGSHVDERAGGGCAGGHRSVSGEADDVLEREAGGRCGCADGTIGGTWRPWLY